jgi:hypothetical protein
VVSALKAILEGRPDLFKGFWIDQTDYDWTPRPVIHLSFDIVSADSVTRLEKDLFSLLENIAVREGVTFNSLSPGICFGKLITDLHLKYGHKPAVLIDEYYAPIISQIGNTELAKDIQSAIGTFY